jgi:hypothetical protein
MQDIVERESLYGVGDATHYGTVASIPPPIPPFMSDVDQSVIVKLDPTSLGTWCEESVFEKPPSSYNKIHIFPILADTLGYLSEEPPLTGTHTVWADKNLTIEDVSPLITPNTFSLWKKDCSISRATASARLLDCFVLDCGCAAFARGLELLLQLSLRFLGVSPRPRFS